MDEPVDLQLFPAWRQAVKEFLEEFQYGSLVSHDWLADHFGLPTHSESQRMTAAEFREQQFEWLANIEAFKTELLRGHQVCLQSVRGDGYRWVPPSEQTKVATGTLEKDLRRAFRGGVQKLAHLRVGELTDDQRRENVDAMAKIASLRQMAKVRLR